MKKERQVKKIGSLLLLLFMLGIILLYSLPEVNDIRGEILEDEIFDVSDKFNIRNDFSTSKGEDNTGEIQIPTSQASGERMRTSTSLRVGDYSAILTEPGDEIILHGKVYPIISKKVPLQMNVLHPDGTHEYNGILWTDNLASITFQ